nr:alpha/beta hydrolase [Mycoplasmopsis bovis]
MFCFARLVVEFVEKNNLKNVTLIGHSLGGGTISLAYQMRPDLFKKLVYIAPMNKPALALYDRYKKDYFPQDYEGFLDLMRSLYYDISKFTSDPEWVKEQKENFDPYLYNNPDIVKLGNTRYESFWSHWRNFKNNQSSHNFNSWWKRRCYLKTRMYWLF